MKKTGKLFATTLLLVCILSMTFTTLLVQASSTGGELTIEITEGGIVIATNVKSGKVFTFDSENPTQKVGGGTFNLLAIPDYGWEFFDWSGSLTGGPDDNPVDFKNVKDASIIATFKLKTYTITSTAIGPTGSGSINPSGDVIVTHGADQEFIFAPATDYHISAIVINGTCSLPTSVTSYKFEDITTDQSIDVYFSEDGTTYVPPGEGSTGFLASEGLSGSLVFVETAGGEAEAALAQYPVGAAGAIWVINVEFPFTDVVTVTLQYDDTAFPDDFDENTLLLIRGETLEAVRCDINTDLVVDGTDVSIIANAVKQELWYNPILDVNNDGFVNEDDVHIVNENKGATLEEIIPDDIDTVNNIITFTTSSFSIWGVRGAYW